MMNRTGIAWSAVALAAGAVASAVVMWAGRPGGAPQAASSTTVSQESTMTNQANASPINFRAQLDGYAHERDALNAADRQARARSLLTQLRADADAGRLDPREASGLADLLWQDAESDAGARQAASDALRDHLRDLAMGERPASPARERQDADYVAQSRKIIDEVVRTVPDREQQRAALDTRLAELRRQIYGTDAPVTHGG
ncbi:phospholipase C accessory protein PlcR [Burkholderia stabilis]|uniref:phospholipase C accessory protein PlcR n=2 Tax=Burkholderia stabilis TaxID=95485 RepID=UPI000851598D|nr:phospholipase C accessory protein PlcR [Burkholderia stabilis]AOR71083.1 phospholipase C accessory protein PlcR [Burkholderia stabilis]HDR9493790.1 phospholipase C accessory protein PlcR [Burkholderia stabilis]HDR9496690.1 phospholipase C accessory protein PlcR [Burkholderia stabilis]HDR9523745.1 phospholipase C accessory protein PlcR [Burkholderia stabilis]HDR9528162.1 phospholipase C accessory protein PlcR [Burkholderia stabilis]